jgi:hypothetical protein
MAARPKWAPILNFQDELLSPRTAVPFHSGNFSPLEPVLEPIRNARSIFTNHVDIFAAMSRKGEGNRLRKVNIVDLFDRAPSLYLRRPVAIPMQGCTVNRNEIQFTSLASRPGSTAVKIFKEIPVISA